MMTSERERERVKTNERAALSLHKLACHTSGTARPPAQPLATPPTGSRRGAYEMTQSERVRESKREGCPQTQTHTGQKQTGRGYTTAKVTARSDAE